MLIATAKRSTTPQLATHRSVIVFGHIQRVVKLTFKLATLATFSFHSLFP